MKNILKVEWSKHNISVQELANKLNISENTLYAIETGEHMPSAILALKIANELKLNVEDIFTLEDKDWFEPETSDVENLELVEHN